MKQSFSFNNRNLFWDIDPATLDPKKHQDFIIERILARGDVSDVRFAEAEYGRQALATVYTKSHTLDPRSASFWSTYLHIPCIEKSSLQTQSAFGTR
jgi:L-lactate utilization protein LutC